METFTIRFYIYTDFLSPISLMFCLLVLLSGNNNEYSQGIGKRCSEKVAILKKPAIQIL